MDLEILQKEISKVDQCASLSKSDKQLQYYEQLSEQRKAQYAGAQPTPFIIYNQSKYRATKLTDGQVLKIRQKYIPGSYGKKQLAKEFMVSATTIYNIIKNKKRKNV